MTRHRSRIVLQITPAGWSNDANNESLSEAAYAEMMPDAPGLMPGNQSIFQGEGGGNEASLLCLRRTRAVLMSKTAGVDFLHDETRHSFS